MTEVEIANMALDDAGKRDISTLADTTTSGNLIRRHLGHVKGKVLAEPTWWEFDKTEQLNPVPDTTYSGTTDTHRYLYNLPNRYRISHVLNSDRLNIADYRLSGNELYCDYSPIYLVYVPRNINVFPEYIGFAMAYLLASRISKKGEGAQSRSELFKLYKQTLSEAKKISRSQQSPDYTGLDGPYSFIDVRGAPNSFPSRQP